MIVCLQCVCSIVVLFFTFRWLLRKFRVGNYGNKYVFITGCDTGFGNLLAKRLDELGFFVFAGCLTDKGSKNLKAACSNRVSVLSLDVTDENSIRNARQQVERNLPSNKGLWAIVNNAGIVVTAGLLEWQTAKDLRRTIEINLFGVIFVTQEFLPLVRREQGRVVNMASILGRFGFAAGVSYVASKFGVEGFSDQLRRELYRTGITVHIIEPGFFKTELFDIPSVKLMLRDRFQQAPLEVRRYYGESFLNQAIEDSTEGVAKFVSSDVFKVVDAYEHAITAKFPKARYVVGSDAQFFFRLLWNLPEWLSDYIVCRRAPIPEGAK